MRFVFLAFFIGIFVGQAQDSTQYKKVIPYAQLSFQSEFQKQLFADLYANNQLDYLAFFISADSSGTQAKFEEINEKIGSFCKAKIGEGIQEKAPKKQIKALYKEVHAVYLEKYEYQNDFVSIFEDGRYNCVSGSALYARVFDELGIDYSIQEFPTHVMLIAYPKGEQIAVETTDPSTGFTEFTPKMKKEYADYLRNNKLISEAEYAEGPDAVFEKNYLVEEVIDFRQLAGIQYNNNAIYTFEKQASSAVALDFAMKAFVLYPTEITLMSILRSVTTILENGNLQDPNRVRCFALASRFKGEFIQNDYILSHLSAVSSNILIAQRDTVQFSQACKAVLENTTDSVLTRSVELLYTVEMGRMYALSSRYNISVNYFLKAFSLDTTNLEVSAITQHSLLNWLSEYDLEIGVNMMDSVLALYPGLANKPEIMQALGDGYLRLFALKYRAQNGSKGEFYKAKFEGLVKPESFRKFKLNRDYFADCYNEAAIYYYKKGQYKKVQDVLQKALSLDPDNYKLKDSQARFR